MNINEKDFFYQATITICRSLDIKQTMRQTFHYLKNFFPLDELQFQLFYKDFSATRAIAIANASGETKTDKIISFTPTIKKMFEKRRFSSDVTIYNRPSRDPLMSATLTLLGHTDSSSLMVLPLLPDGIKIGALVMVARGQDRYTDYHARLLKMLHDPFAIAMSNTLRYGEILKLKDILADDNRFLSRELRQLAGDEIVGAKSGIK